MFVQDETSHNSLNRPQLKWLLAVLLALMIGVVVWAVIAFQNRKADSNVMMNGKKAEEQKENERPSPEEIQQQLEQLRPTDSDESNATPPSSTAIQKQLEMLKKDNQGNQESAPTPEEIQKQLEMLRK